MSKSRIYLLVSVFVSLLIFIIGGIIGFILAQVSVPANELAIMSPEELMGYRFGMVLMSSFIGLVASIVSCFGLMALLLFLVKKPEGRIEKICGSLLLCFSTVFTFFATASMFLTYLSLTGKGI